MKLKDVLPQGIIGAFVTVVLLIVIEAYSAVTSQSLQSDAGALVTVLVMSLLAFTAGGFIAAYLASKKGKDALDRSLGASSFSAVVSTLAVAALTLFNLASGGVIFSDMLIASALAVFLGVVALAASSIGGFAYAAVAGKGQSIIALSVKKLWKSYAKSWKSIALPLGFALVWMGVLSLSYLFEGMEENMSLAGSALILLVSLLITAFWASSIVLAVKKKHGLKELLNKSLIAGKRVFVALFLLAIPLAAAWGLLLQGADSEYAVVVTPVLILLSMVYAIAFSFVPQSLIMGRKKLGGAFKDSFAFVGRHLALVLGVFAVSLLLTVAMEIVLLFVDFAAFSAGIDSSLVTSWISVALSTVFTIGLLSALYAEAKK